SVAQTTQSGLSAPNSVIADTSNGLVYAVDTANNRILSYDGILSEVPTPLVPSANETNVSSTPNFQMSSNDRDGDAVQYRLDIARDSAFTNSVQTFDQTLSSVGWSGQTIGNTYSYGTAGSFELPTANILTANTTYWWRVSAYDPSGTRTWTSVSTPQSFTTAPPVAISVGSAEQSIVAGQVSSAIHLELRDSNGNLVKSGTSTRVYLTSSSGGGQFSAQQTPFSSIGFIDIPANAAGVDVYYSDSIVANSTLTFSDASPPDGVVGLADATQLIEVTSNDVAYFTFANIGNQIAGAPFSTTIVAKDTYGNTVSDFNGTTLLTSSLEIPSPTSIDFVGGLWTGNIALTKAGNTKLVATYGGALGESNTFTVVPGDIASVSISPPALNAKAGSSTNLTATAIDMYGNAITTGVTYAWSAPGSIGTISPVNQSSTTLIAAGLIATGDVTVSATKTATVQAVSNVTIIPDHYSISTIPSTVTAGGNIATTITAMTASNAVISNATGSVSASDLTNTVYPQTINLVNGEWIGNFSITMIRQDDSINLSSHSGVVTGSSNTFTVTPAVLNSVTIIPNSVSLSVDGSTSVSAQAYDQYNNVINTNPYTWTTSIGSIQSSGQSVTYNAGTASGSGNIMVTVNEGAIEKTATIPVNITANGVHHFSFTTITNKTAGQNFQVTILAKDEFDNTVSSYSGSGTLTYSAGTITPSVTTDFTNGTWTGNVRVTKSGTGVTLGYSDAGKSGLSNVFTVTPSPLDSVAINPASAIVQLESTQALGAIAYDSYGNEITNGVSFSWSLTDNTLGSLSPTSGQSTTL
ncbi:MAG: hypothetical protein WAW80_05465, partial [Candidatus Saccharimonadales bacterium]